MSNTAHTFCRLPLETVHSILRWAEDYAVAIKVESMLANIPSRKQSWETVYEGFQSSDFPVSMELTESFTLLPGDIDASSVSLSVVAWLIRFRPEIFWKREGLLVRTLAGRGRLRALQLVGSSELARSQAFEWGEVDVAAGAGHFDVVRYLHETMRVSFTAKTLGLSARSGNFELLKYLHSREAECSNDSLVEAFCSGNADVVRFILENYPGMEFYTPYNNVEKRDSESYHLLVTTEYPGLQDLILAVQPEFMMGAMVKAAENGDLARLSHIYDLVGLQVPSKVVETAAASNHLHIVKYLVEEWGADVSALSSVAAENGALEVLDYAIGSGVRPNDVFHAACKGGHVNVIEYLHAMLPDACFTPTDPRNSLFRTSHFFDLADAASNGRLDAVKYFEQHCPAYNAVWAMEKAMEAGQTEVFEYLAPLVDLEDVEHLLGATARQGNLGLVKRIVAGWQKTETENTVIDDAAQGRDTFHVIKFLYETGKFDFTEKALVAAVVNRNREIVRFLVKAKPCMSLLDSLKRSLTDCYDPCIFSFLDRHLTNAERELWKPADMYAAALDAENLLAVRYILECDPGVADENAMMLFVIAWFNYGNWGRRCPTFCEFLASKPALLKRMGRIARRLFAFGVVDIGAVDAVRALWKRESGFVVPGMDDEDCLLFKAGRERVLRYLRG
ncbi:hypothetical protein HDU97_002876 [Phlyctochytrium planicorne]|nr:hypothetical protein HDU97_002876 [Phlyctochytrium planicorne]